jgi:hypothetical protein
MKSPLKRVLYASIALAFACALSGTRHNLAAVEAAQEHTFTATAGVVPNDPFVTNNGQIPPASQYNGPMFSLSHAWPSKPLPPMKDPPWQQAIGGGQITPGTAAAYVEALKQYVSANARVLLLDYKNWDAAKAGWYTEPWLGSIRESIHGTYSASQFGPSVFPGTGLATTFDTHVLTYYDERAAYALYKVWGETATNPAVSTANFQFPEGSVIVKAAIFASDDPAIQQNWWPVTNGAAAWPIYFSIPEQANPSNPPIVQTGYVMQFDIIVKDSIAAPQTGWVFSTLVYDVSAQGDAWDKMVPLGAQWGNDPGVDPETNPSAKLQENWINPNAPLYSTQTLGWGGRLSGPNDGARNDIQVGKKVLLNHPDSSCMSCHSPAQWQPVQHKMLTFLFPSYPNPNTKPNQPPFKPCPNGLASDPYVCSPAPASADWNRWFQNRLGTEPFDPKTGSIATDFDMVFAFKTLPAWWSAGPGKNAAVPFAMRELSHGQVPPAKYNEYTGAPLKPQK